MVDLLAVHPNQVSVNDVRNKINEILNEGIGGAVHTDPNPPTAGTESDGDLWFDETTSVLYVYTDSVNGWVQTNGGSGSSGTTNPAGADNEVQFNDNGSFGASDKFTYDGGTVNVPRLFVTAMDSASEGGEMVLEKPPNSTLNGSVFIDIYNDYLRIFEGASPYKGAYLDLTECGNYVAGTQSNLLGGGGGGQKTLLDTPTVLHARYNANGMQFEYITSQVTTTSGTIEAGVTSGVPGTATAVQLHGITNSGSSGVKVGFLVKHPSQTTWKRVIPETMADGAYYPTTEIAWYPLDSDGKLEWKVETVSTSFEYLLLEIQGYEESGGGPRAYVAFDGRSSNVTGTMTSSFNVSSITDVGTGTYDVNLTSSITNPILSGGPVGEYRPSHGDITWRENHFISMPYDTTSGLGATTTTRIRVLCSQPQQGGRQDAPVNLLVH